MQALIVGLIMGFYNSLFGPGVGTVAIMGFTMLMHYDARVASGNGKVLITNYYDFDKGLRKKLLDALQPHFEVNLTSDKLTNILNDTFNNFIKLKETKIKQQYDIPRLDKTVSLSTDVITLVAKKQNNN